MRTLFLIAAVALGLGSSLTGVAAQQAPKRGGIFNFAVTAEPPNYDCHQAQSYAFLHPLAAAYSYLVRHDPSQGANANAKCWPRRPWRASSLSWTRPAPSKA